MFTQITSINYVSCKQFDEILCSNSGYMNSFRWSSLALKHHVQMLKQMLTRPSFMIESFFYNELIVSKYRNKTRLEPMQNEREQVLCFKCFSHIKD